MDLREAAAEFEVQIQLKLSEEVFTKKFALYDITVPRILN